MPVAFAISEAVIGPSLSASSTLALFWPRGARADAPAGFAARATVAPVSGDVVDRPRRPPLRTRERASPSRRLNASRRRASSSVSFSCWRSCSSMCLIRDLTCWAIALTSGMSGMPLLTGVRCILVTLTSAGCAHQQPAPPKVTYDAQLPDPALEVVVVSSREAGACDTFPVCRRRRPVTGGSASLRRRAGQPSGALLLLGHSRLTGTLLDVLGRVPGARLRGERLPRRGDRLPVARN